MAEKTRYKVGAMSEKAGKTVEAEVKYLDDKDSAEAYYWQLVADFVSEVNKASKDQNYKPKYSAVVMGSESEDKNVSVYSRYVRIKSGNRGVFLFDVKPDDDSDKFMKLVGEMYKNGP